jgi:DNA-binding IclR family transcriptional regulator
MRDVESRVDGQIQSVGRALDLLEALSREELGLVELARRAKLHPSTTHRMLATLTQRGYVQRRPSGLFALGRRVGYLGVALCANEQAIKSAAEPSMRRVQMVSKQTVNVAVLEGRSVAFVAYLRGEQATITRRPALLPAHVSACGKVLMAFAESRRLGRDQLERMTHRTITDYDRLEAELETIRSVGWTSSRGEFHEDITCVAAPIFASSGDVVAAMSVAGPDARLSPELDDIAELVRTAALDVSSALGYQGHDPLLAIAS